MAEYGWHKFEWDDENKKSGNVQHLRDHHIEPHEAEECFFHNYDLARDNRRFDEVYIIDGRTDRGKRLRLVPGQRRRSCAGGHWLGNEAEEKAKVMKRKLSTLSESEQENAEDQYHRMRPEDFDEIMSSATRHTPNAVRLPSRLVEKLKTIAEQKGESEYKKMVKTWIEERLREEVGAR